MKNFPDELHFNFHSMNGDSMLYRITKEFRYNSFLGWVTIPEGFVTDGASVPQIFWNIFPPTGSYFPAALVHDYLYSKASDDWMVISREDIDKIFLMAMKDVGVSWIKRAIIHRAVRLAGWKFFKQK